MNDLFKNVSWYIMQEAPILKYILLTQETYDEAMRREPHPLEFFPQYFET